MNKIYHMQLSHEGIFFIVTSAIIENYAPNVVIITNII